jgi:cell division protein FtsZ
MGLAMMGTGIAEGQDRAMEAARRAISSPLLEGASVNGSRGVIINVTGGPDLSLVEVCEASSIVQEAADEDANIIFGAVVDPTLKGKVKITVIATGFGPPAATRSPDVSVPTPVDLSAYADQPRLRAEPPGSVPGPGLDRGLPARFSIARRPAVELAPASPAPLPMSAGAADGGSLAARGADADAELNSPFDIPAFLRRQEG